MLKAVYSRNLDQSHDFCMQVPSIIDAISLKIKAVILVERYMTTGDTSEHTSLLALGRRPAKRGAIPEVNENEVISYVQSRRASIASGIEIPVGHVEPYGRRQLPASDRRSDQLFPAKSNTSVVEGILAARDDLIPIPPTNYYTEFVSLMKCTCPLIVTFLLQYSLTVASVFSVGRLGSNELAAISLSSMTANISGYAIFQGVSTCLDTLCGQAYGRKEYHVVGQHFVRCTYLLFFVFVPIFIIWFFASEQILLLLIGKDSQELCKLASRYLQILSFGIPGYILFENGKHFLQAQGIFHASTYVLLFAAPLNAFLNYVLVWDAKFGIGFDGAPLSVVITDWIMAALLFSYVFFVKGKECWPKGSLFSVEYIKNWSRMINLCIPGVLMVEAEWLAFEIITFTAAKFGTKVLAAQSVISTTCVLLYQVPFALSIAASVRIAWYIGAASKNSAIIATQTTLLTALALGTVSGTFLYVFRHWLASLFTNDKVIIKLASNVLIIGAIYQVNDFLSCATAGVLRSQGRQKIGGILNIISYYLIALPFAFFFAFYFHLELFGLWIGMILGLFFVSLTQYYFVATSNWDDIIDRCINEGITHEGRQIDAHSLVPSVSTGNSYIV